MANAKKKPKQRPPDARLLPCPFCGYEAQIDTDNSIACTNCAAGMIWDVTEMRTVAMIKAWNRREG
jgi:transcription elongation factor Elf1